MWPLAILAGLWTSRVLAMHMDTFLQAFNRLGLTQWDGIEQDIAWGHVTSLMGLSRPSIDGPLFIYRAPCLIGGQSPRRVRLMATTNSGPEPLLVELASHFEDLADPEQFEPWRLLAIDTSRGRSRNRELHHPCYILVDFCAFRSFGLRPHGVIEVVLGQEEFSFPIVLPMAVNVVVLGDFLAPLLLTGLQGLQWQAWLNGDLLGLPLVTCQEGFFIQVQVWCGPTLMQNMMIAAPLIVGTLHLDMDAMPDTSLVRVTTYIPGGNYSHLVTYAHGYVSADNDGDQCVGGIAKTLWGPAIGWVSCGPGFILLSLGMLRSSLQTKKGWSWSMTMVSFNLMQLYCSGCLFPPFLGKEPSTALGDYARGIWLPNLAWP